MLTLRSLARSVPRISSQLATRSSRNAPLLRIQTLASPIRQATPSYRSVAAFSSSVRRLQEDALTVKLAQEIGVEKDLINAPGSKASEQKEAIENYLTQSGFDLHDLPGTEEVILSKKHGDEIIRVTFSIADINNEPYNEEDNYQEEGVEAEAAAEAETEAKEESERPEGEFETFPVKLNVTISKAGKPGALCIEALTQYGGIMIDDFWYFPDSKLTKAETFDLEKKRANTYAGPPFGNLDEDLQSLIDGYLSERGINESLAEFVIDYVDYKEQQEYVHWLENVKSFFD